MSSGLTYCRRRLAPLDKLAGARRRHCVKKAPRRWDWEHLATRHSWQLARIGEVLAINTKLPRTFGNILPQDTLDRSLVERGWRRSTCHKHPISMPSQDTGQRAPSLCCLIGLGSSQMIWPGGSTPLRLPHPVCFLYVSGFFNLPAITTSSRRWL
jgi:hypothetical protein